MTGILAVILAYLVGAIPFGYLIVKFSSGRDVRSEGSGNIGATNVLRTTGQVPAVITLVAGGSWKGEVYVWKVSDGTVARTFNASPGYVAKK